MPKNAVEVSTLLSGVLKEMRAEFMRLSVLDRKVKGLLTSTWMPKNADGEYRDLFRKASGPWLEFTADAITQGIRVDGCNSTPVWEVWQANGMDGRQNATTREGVRLGKSFVMVLPPSRTVEVVDEEDQPTGEVEHVADRGPGSKPVMRPLSTLNTYAYFADPWDDYPQWVLSRIGPTKPSDFWNSRWMFVDGEAVYRFEGSLESIKPETFTVFVHGLDYCPVAQVSNTLPAVGEPQSSVERAIPIYQRIVDATFTLEMVQRYGAFPQKWATGATLGSGVNISADSMIESPDHETRFGNFQTANLTDVVAAVDAHIKHLAAVCQVPPHYLLGAVVNMSAEGIAAAESGYFRNIGERQDSMSEGYELALRIVADLIDVQAETIEVHFEDVSSRSLAQLADAITKLAALMPESLEKLFVMLPGFTQRDAIQAAAGAPAPAPAQPLAIEPPTPPGADDAS